MDPSEPGSGRRTDSGFTTFRRMFTSGARIGMTSITIWIRRRAILKVQQRERGAPHGAGRGGIRSRSLASRLAAASRPSSSTATMAFEWLLQAGRLIRLKDLQLLEACGLRNLIDRNQGPKSQTSTKGFVQLSVLVPSWRARLTPAMRRIPLE